MRVLRLVPWLETIRQSSSESVVAGPSTAHDDETVMLRSERQILSAGGVVVGVRCGLGGAVGFGDMAQIDPDAIPDAGAATHAVDEDVVDGEVTGGFGKFFFPAGKAGFGCGFIR